MHNCPLSHEIVGPVWRLLSIQKYAENCGPKTEILISKVKLCVHHQDEWASKKWFLMIHERILSNGSLSILEKTKVWSPSVFQVH